jgi:hypothetical protein
VQQAVADQFNSFKQVSDLSDKELKFVLDNAELIIDFVNSVKARVQDRLMGGTEFEGYKLVEGRSIRKFRDESFVIERLKESLGDAMYEKSLIGIQKAEKLLKAKGLEHMLDELIERTKPKLTIVSMDDKREAINLF